MLRDDGTKTRHVREQRYENRPADDGAEPGIPAGTGMQTGLSRTSLPVILGFLPIILSFSLLSCAFPCPPEFSPPVILSFPHVILSAAKDLLSPAARQRNGEKDPSSAPPPQDDRAEARHADDRTEARHA